MNALRDILKEKDITYQDLSDELNIPLRTIERDIKSDDVPAERAIIYGDYLDCELSELNSAFRNIIVTYINPPELAV